MSNYSARIAVEQFHLLFLEQLGKIIDKQLTILKGGCNLRFFLKSIRYSEDIDIDVRKISKETLQKNVRKVLSSPGLKMALKERNLEILEYSEPKQTETVQRWKIALKSTQTVMPVNTKVEFSRRDTQKPTAFELIDSMLTRNYGLVPVFFNHYTGEAALCQKIEALAGRTETQARDVFDIYHLIHIGIESQKILRELKVDFLKAKENAMSLSFADFKSQVLSYLPIESQTEYGGAGIWDQMVLEVVQLLEVES